MIRPPYLKQGDKVGIVSTARKLKPEEIEKSVACFRSWGLEVVAGRHLFSECHQFAGTDAERTTDMQSMLDDPGIRAVFCGRGGYGTVRIIDRLNFRAFTENPKWIVGFSDVTVLHTHIYRHTGVETIHGPMPHSFFLNELTDASLESLHKALFGEPLSYSWESMLPTRAGTATGQLTGGNLSMLYAVTGTASDIDTRGKILFIEDIDEYLYHIDRMMLNLKRSGRLEGLSGLLVGAFSEMKDNQVPFGKNPGEIIFEALEGYSFPCAMDFPAGHIDDNRSLIMGREATLVSGTDNWLMFKE